MSHLKFCSHSQCSVWMSSQPPSSQTECLHSDREKYYLLSWSLPVTSSWCAEEYLHSPSLLLLSLLLLSLLLSLCSVAPHHVEFEIKSLLARRAILISYCSIKIITYLNIFIKVWLSVHPPSICSGSEDLRALVESFLISEEDIFQNSWQGSTCWGLDSSLSLE